MTRIPIKDVKPEIFHQILYCLYGGEISDEDLKANAKELLDAWKELLDACDEHSMVNLKLQAEAVLTATTTINIDNVMELLRYSDDKNWALLKEKVMDSIVEIIYDQ